MGGRAVGKAVALTVVGVALGVGACNEPGSTVPEAGVSVELEVVGLAALDTITQGAYQAWFVDDAGGLHPGDRFAVASTGGQVVAVTSPVPDPAHVMVTLEPAGDTLPGPSQLKILGGHFSGGRATLGTTGYLTPNIPLEPEPGVHVLDTWAHIGTPDVPQVRDAGLWLMDPTRDTLSGRYQTFTPLTEGWLYEGWVVRDRGAEDEAWFSYGKFRPNAFRQANRRDETGLGPFSGKVDYERALPNDVRVPGDDWLANPLGVPVPGGLALPLDLNGDRAAGLDSRWSHVITVEPWEERYEDPWRARPFFLRPYGNAIGGGPPDSLRTIRFAPEGLPTGSARLGG